MPYEILDETKAVPYLLTLQPVRDFFGTDNIEAREIGDGNLNYVYSVYAIDNPKKKLILKQAVPYLRIAGDGYKLSRKRMNYEIRSLQLYNRLISQHVPEVLYADEAMSVIVLEFLEGQTIMREGMIAALRYPKFAEHMGTFLAQTLFKTSSLFLSAAEKEQLQASFNGNSELCALTQTFVFTAPYMEHETNVIDPHIEAEAKALRHDDDFKVAMLELKYRFMTQTDALLHGDLHTGSIMLNHDKTSVIDSEFAFFGPFGFDVGALMANMIMAWISHTERSKDEAYMDWILETIEALYGQFERRFLALWSETGESAMVEAGCCSRTQLQTYRGHFMLNILQESLGFAGAKMCRRQLGIAGVADIREIEQPQARARAEKMALAVGIYLVKHYRGITKISDLTDYLKGLR